jgi:hypothetical protein
VASATSRASRALGGGALPIASDEDGEAPPRIGSQISRLSRGQASIGVSVLFVLVRARRSWLQASSISTPAADDQAEDHGEGVVVQDSRLQAAHHAGDAVDQRACR